MHPVRNRMHPNPDPNPNPNANPNQAARYNRYFDAHGVDLLLIPAARSPYAAQLGSNPGQLQGSYRAVAGQLQASWARTPGRYGQ